MALVAGGALAGAPAAATAEPALDATATATGAPADAATGAAGAAGRRGPAIAARYSWQAAAPARLPDGSANRAASTAVGIDASGRVGGNSLDGQGYATHSFLGAGRHSRWLPSAADRFVGAVGVTAVAPNGTVVGGAGSPENEVPIWDRRGRLRFVTTPQSHYGPGPAVVNSAGVIAGAVEGVKVSDLFYARNASATTVRDARFGNYRVTGISEAGVAVGSRHHPYMPNDGHYPEGIVFTGAGVQNIKTDQTSAVDAISPNGRYLVGRVGPDLWEEQRGAMAWLSTSKSPVLLRGADRLRARAVSDAGVVAGSSAGRASLWHRGRLVDLNDRVRGLPRGWVLTDVVAINKRGALAVNATDAAGAGVALQLVPNGR